VTVRERLAANAHTFKYLQPMGMDGAPAGEPYTGSGFLFFTFLPGALNN